MSSSSDPSGFVTNPPSTIVKVTGTARDDVNGQLGVVLQFDTNRERYLVHMMEGQQAMSFKPINLVKASYIEQMKATWMQVQRDPRIQQQVQNVRDRLPVPLEYVAIGSIVVLLLTLYLLGLTKTLMLLSLMLLLGMTIGPDLLEPNTGGSILQKFPMRAKYVLEQNFTFLQNRLTPSMAVAIYALLILFCLQALIPWQSFVYGSRTSAELWDGAATTSSGPSRLVQSAQLEEYYKLGFDDATQNLEFGTSLSSKQLPRDLGEFGDPPIDFVTPPPKASSKFGFGTAMSLFYLYRMGKELGTDATGAGPWDAQRAMANLKLMEPWKLGLLGFSVYNLVKPFLT